MHFEGGSGRVAAYLALEMLSCCPASQTLLKEGKNLFSSQDKTSIEFWGEGRRL